MKKLFLFLLLSFTAATASAQYIEVVHLKTGSMIRGIITEQIPNRSLKIQTADGSIFVYTFDEIERITKEMSAQRRTKIFSFKNLRAASFNPKYEGSVDIGYSIDVHGYGAGRVSISTSHGCRIIPYLYVGAGMGFDYYHGLNDLRVPIFGDFRGYFTKGKVKPFLNFRIGYTLFTGFYLAPSVGVNYQKLDISLGYTYQGAKIYDIYGSDWWRYYSENVNLGGLTFKVGIRF